MRRTILFSLSATLILAALLLSGCSKPWTHNKLRGSAADYQYKIDVTDCQAIAGKEYPLDKRAHDKLFVECMTGKGWLYHPDGKGFRFQTKPR